MARKFKNKQGNVEHGYLVLSRGVDESLVIDEQIEIKIFRIGHGKVRIGTKAPPHIHIRRGELPPGTAEVTPS